MSKERVTVATERDRRESLPIPITIAGRPVGPGHSCFVIAEAGVNHNGNVDLACRLVDAAVAARADAVKFQTFTADLVAAKTAPKAQYQLQTASDQESQLEMIRRLELPAAAFLRIADYCRRRGIIFLSTPFDEASVDLLRKCEVPAFKIPSGEITNLVLVDYIARQGLPLIISTGMSDLEEVAACVATVRQSQNSGFALLHCVSGYPSRAEDSNLRAMATLADRFRVPVGYSDHTLGIEVACAAVALGASILEKHVTLDPSMPGPDHRMSLDPSDLTAFVAAVRNVEQALGDGTKRPVAAEADVHAAARRSIVASRAVAAGTRLTAADLAFKRPGTGLPVTAASALIGRTTRRPLTKDELIDWDALTEREEQMLDPR